jgi:hypothetical protein
LNRYRSGFVLGYHGCDEDAAEAILAGVPMAPSERDYDWLGPGAYFWEADLVRAQEWADARVVSKAYKKAAVVGAVIELGNCLDLTVRSNLELLASAFESLKRAFDKAGKTMPQNRNLGVHHTADKPLRFLDCAVIKHLHDNIEADANDQRARGEVPTIEPFDTVRGMFLEGGEVYPGCGFYTHTHTQIAVRSATSVRGYFRPR